MLPRETFVVTFGVDLIYMSLPQALPKSAAVARVSKSSDGFERLVVVVNGRTPGRTIWEQQGITVIVDVRNSLHGENTGVQFHVIQEVRDPMKTHAPLGSYLYHTYYDIQWSTGLYGSIQTTLPEGMAKPFYYDHEYNIILKDRWHKSIIEQSPGISMNFDWINKQQSLLPKGNHAKLSMVICNVANQECSPFMLHVMAGRTYLLHVLGINSLAALNFEIEGHNMTIIVIDGHYVQPFVVKNLNIYYGGTYNILVTMDQEPTHDYWISTYVMSEQQKSKTFLGILYYYPTMTMEPVISYWNDTTNCISQSQWVQVIKGNDIMMPLIPDCITTSFNTQNEMGGNMSLHSYVWVGIILAVIIGWIFIPVLVLVLWRYEVTPGEIDDEVDYEAHAPYAMQPIAIIFLIFMIIYMMILWM